MTRLLACLLVAVAACATSTDMPRDGGTIDVGVDAPMRAPRDGVDGGVPTVYTPCRNDADCPGVFCNLDYPSGVCSPPCGTDADCPENGTCYSNTCHPSCRPGANDCRDDMFCDPTRGTCFASCSTRRDATAQHCQTFGDACQASFCASAMVHPGVPNGGPCSGDDDCIEFGCVDELTFGWPHGTCAQLMRAPGLAAYQSSGPAPSGGCLDGDVVVPLFGTEGDEAACIARCTADTDCRDGYHCDRHVIYDAPEHTDGACVPWWCGDPFDTPCPADRTCTAFSGSLSACFHTPP